MEGEILAAAEADGPEDARALLQPETELQFFSRRAMEESRLAKQASCPAAAARHAYLAAAYAGEIAKELAKAAEFDKLLHALP